jgi:biopolymer transport protein ExbD
MSTATAAATWKIRHEGSPRSVDDLTLAQVLEGMQDGLWEATDEVIGPGETEWTAIENHPQLADVAADLEPPPARTYDDETRLDMNALIDVCLVLLIFFMLITSYSILQKRLEQPSVTELDPKHMTVVRIKDAQEQMLHVKVTMENDHAVIRMEDNVLDANDLEAAFSRARKGTTKTELLLEAEYDVPHSALVAIQDAASGARLSKIHRVMPKEQAKPAKN